MEMIQIVSYNDRGDYDGQTKLVIVRTGDKYRVVISS